MQNQIDHFTVGSESLEAGVSALSETLGLTIPRGSKHDAMSTHNCVTRTADGCFLELITIDPDAPSPGRVRWFSLDEPRTQERLKEGPRALCWVVRTDDLDGVIANSPVDLGEVIPLSRGDLRWRLTVPKDGSLPEGGLIPAFIEWSPGPHPSAGMQDVGIRLESIELGHPDPARIQSMLEQLGISHLASVFAADEPTLRFTVKTPDGASVVLS